MSEENTVKKPVRKAPAKRVAKTAPKTTPKKPTKTPAKTPAKKKAPVKAKAKSKPVVAKAEEKTEKVSTITQPASAVDPKVQVSDPVKKDDNGNILRTSVARSIFSENSTSLAGIPDNLSESERKEAVRNFVKQSRHMEGCLALVQGEALYEVMAGNYWNEWGFDSFRDYVEQEMEFKFRKAYYLVEIYQKFVIELGLRKDELASLEWTKARELLPIIDKDNASRLLKNIQGKSLVEIKEWVKQLKSPKAVPSADSDEAEEDDKTVRISCILKGGQVSNVNSALELAKQATGSDSIGNLLDLICTEYLVSSADDQNVQALVGLEDHLENLKRIYNVDIEVKN